MRIAVIYRPRNAPPLEAAPRLAEELGRWVEHHRARFSTIELFVGGGGFGVIDVEDSTELQRIVAENPYTPYAEVEFRPVVEPSAGMAASREAMAARAEG